MVDAKNSEDVGLPLALVGDVGATHARFQLCAVACDDQSTQPIGDPVILPTAGYTEADKMLSDVMAALSSPDVVYGVIAVAGPLSRDGASIKVINTGLMFYQAVAEACLSAPVAFFNDFYAQAMAVPVADRLQQFGGGGVDHGVKALLGPGSGLGMATLLPGERGGAWRVLPSEGGHADLAPGSFLENELWAVLAQQHAHVSWETVLSGPGLGNLYQAMCSLWGSPPQTYSSEQITTLGKAVDDPICHQTLETFASLLGSAAGNMALTVGARGGVYIGGGIAPQLIDFLPTSPFRRRFDERGALSHFVTDIPLLVICDDQPGLLGARQLLSGLYNDLQH